jgi:flagellar motor switch protein FliG
MVKEDLGRILALLGSHLPSPVRSRFFAVLPEALRKDAQGKAEAMQELAPENLSIVEQVLLRDLEVLFGEEEATSETVALPIHVADVLTLVLRKASITQGADIVRRLPEGLQAEVLHLIATHSWSVWERRLDSLELSVMMTLREALGLQDFPASPNFTAEILHHQHTPGDVRRNLTYLYEKEPDSTAFIQNYLYGFESLAHLPDRELQIVLKGVDHWDLILAMRAVPTNVRRKVLANLSERRSALFVEDEATLADVEADQVEMVQHQMMDRARLLYESGGIRTYLGSIAGQDGDTGQSEGGEGGSPVSRKSHMMQGKREVRGKLGFGIAALVLVGSLGLVVHYGLGQSQSSQSLSGKGRAAIVSQTGGEVAATGSESAPARSNAQQVARAATVSGKAVLISGETVSDLGSAALLPGDRISTDQTGRATVDLDDDVGGLQVEPESEVEVGAADLAPLAAPQLNLRVGNIWVRVNDPALAVRSPLAEVTASKGALYHLRITLNATTILSVHGGTVWVGASNGGGLHVLGRGERLRIEPGGDVHRDRHAEVSQWLGARE